MNQLLTSMRDAWQAYTALILLAAAIVAFAGLPSRMAAMEKRQDEQDTGLRYVICVLGSQSRGYDATACESHLSLQLLDYLRPRVRP